MSQSIADRRPSRDGEQPKVSFVPVSGQAVPSWLDDQSVTDLRLREGLVFPMSEFRERWTRVRRRLSAANLDALVVFRPSSVEYLSGYRTSTSTETPLVITHDEVALILPTAEVGRAIVAGCPDQVVFADTHLDRVRIALTSMCDRLQASARVGLEFGDPFTPVRTLEIIEATGRTATNGNFLVESERLRLSEAEVERMRAAAILTGTGFRAAQRAATTPGVTDSTIAAAMLSELAPTTDSLVKPEVVVCTGWRGGVTHSNWNNTPVQRDTTTFLEFTGSVNHYVAPVMRTLLHGRPSREVRYLDDQARKALELTIESLRPGVRCCDIARRVTDALGELDPHVVWHYTYGYPVGLAHGATWVDTVPFEMLSIRADCTTELEPGMAFHLPISFRWFGNAAVGHSETVLLTENGLEILTEPAGDPVLTPVDSE